MTDPAAPEGLLEVGYIRRPHGVKGDTYVDLMTDREERLAVGSRLWARGQWRTVTMAKHLPQRWLVHFEGFDDRTAIEALTNSALLATIVGTFSSVGAASLPPEFCAAFGDLMSAKMPSPAPRTTTAPTKIIFTREFMVEIPFLSDFQKKFFG